MLRVPLRCVPLRGTPRPGRPGRSPDPAPNPPPAQDGASRLESTGHPQGICAPSETSAATARHHGIARSEPHRPLEHRIRLQEIRVRQDISPCAPGIDGGWRLVHRSLCSLQRCCVPPSLKQGRSLLETSRLRPGQCLRGWRRRAPQRVRRTRRCTPAAVTS